MHKTHAFTLVELLVVIAVITVLAALLLPTMEQSIEQGRRVVCANNQKQLYVASAQYAGDYNDRLPFSGQTAGGANVNLSQLDDLSTDAWAASYVGVQLYSTVKQYNGVPLPSGFVANAYFYTPEMRGPLACPGSKLGMTGSWQSADKEFDYWMAGFGAGNPLGLSYNAAEAKKCWHSRFTNAAAMVQNAPKAFIVDNCWITPQSNAPYLYQYATCHAPGAPAGVNVTAGDGAARWTDSLYQMDGWSGTKAAPRGYYAQQYWFTQTTYQQCVIGFPNGTNAQYKTSFNPAEYEFWRRQWY